MRHLCKTAFLLLLLSGLLQPVSAEECYADYKAKKDGPLRLHYGVIALNGACTKPAAREEIAKRLQQSGWTLLNLQAIFGPEGLDQRKADAGPFFLRF